LTAPAPRSLVLVVNQDSGRARRLLRRAREALAREGLGVQETLDVRHLDRLRKVIEERPESRPMIVAAGGDGTVGAVVGYLADSDAILGILPLGTSNDVARTLRIPPRIEDAVHLLATGKVVTIDIGQFVAQGSKPQYFVHAAAIGLTTEFARLATQRGLRKRLGRFTYAVAGMIAVRNRQPLECELQLEGRRITCCLVHLSVINAPVFGGRFALSIPGSNIDDRRLDVLAIENMPLYRIVLEAVFLLLRKRPNVGGMQLYHVRRLHIHSDRPQQVTLDGELAGRLPGDFNLIGEGLRVIAPPSFNDVDA